MVDIEMPPRSSPPAPSLLASDSNQEVVCPLRNPDGSGCRKRCVGEKRYRSMQEHIRRAHPERYISKLPATEESFLLMINTPPSERAQDQPELPHNHIQASSHDRYQSNSGTPQPDDDHPVTSAYPTVSAAAALAQLHGHKMETDWDADGLPDFVKYDRRTPRNSIELPPILSNSDQPPHKSTRPRETLPSLLSSSPPGRSSTLPPLYRPPGFPRPRKLSVSKRGREPHHKKQRSKGSNTDLFRRLQEEDQRFSHDRKALSAEPMPNYGKRWEDLIDAADQAASAAGDLDDERTPVPQSPVSMHRASLPPVSFHHQSFQTASYQASPLQQALTPPSYNQSTIDPFPTVESGENFHMESHGLTDSSPPYPARSIQIYCAACRAISLLKESFACTECICGLCQACVDVLLSEQGARRQCPRCATIGGRFKPFQLDIR